MTIQYASDLHLEFVDNDYFLHNQPLKPGADILLLARDICLLRELGRYNWFFDYVSANFGTTYWIPGNHEYYHYDQANKCDSFMETIRPNVFLVNDYAVTIDNVRLICSTLWTKVKPKNQFAIEKRMNDFHLIKYNGNRLTCDDLASKHEASVAFIRDELLAAQAGLKTLVMTHHVPTFINYPPEYFGDVLNEAFAVNLNKLFMEGKPDH